MQDEFAATAVPAASARHRFEEQLRTMGWPQPDHGDLLLAVNEAVENACTHAYPPAGEPRADRDGDPGTVGVHTRLMSGPGGWHRLLVTVTDQGRWREPVPASRGGQPARRGLALMRAATAHLRITGTPAGTRVVMMSRPVRLPG